jgi:hypothetical protein
MFAAVYGEIGLAIAVEIELAQVNTRCGGFFENSGGYGVPVPENFARLADVERDDLHAGIIG